MAIIKMAELNRRFTEIVAQYMAQGLVMNLNAMSGTQGEVGKVALANDKVVYIIHMDRDHEGSWSEGRYYDTMNIRVEMFERDCRDLISSSWVTYWLGKGTVVYEEAYYEISDRRDGKVWVDSKEECDRLQDIRTARREARGYRFSTWQSVNYDAATIVEVLKFKTGRKRVFVENIVSVEKCVNSNSWRINYVFSGKCGSVCVRQAA